MLNPAAAVLALVALYGVSVFSQSVNVLEKVPPNIEAAHSIYTISNPTEAVPWPLPQSYQSSSSAFRLDANQLSFYVSGVKCSLIDDAIHRCFSRMFGREYVRKRSQDKFFYVPMSRLRRHSSSVPVAGSITTISVFLQYPCGEYPSLDSDESYQIRMGNSTDGTLYLSAISVWGIIRGLTTISQLVYRDGNGAIYINGTTIHDEPRFKWRGTLSDTSRHFIAKKVLFQHLDLMEYNKMNVFHWHIVDESSFPYQSYSFPSLSDKGAYNPYSHIYTQEDVADVIEYARRRGIRVVPEFDTPGHTLSWGKGWPGFLTQCFSGGKFDNTFGPVDPTQQANYQRLATFFGEIKKVFPDKYLHLGGDEVSFLCWQSNPNITNFMKLMKFGTDYSRLESYYEQKLLNIMKNLSASYVVWQEVLDNGVQLNKDTVAHVWKGGDKWQPEMTTVTKKGYHTLLSSCWYLDYISYAKDWINYYNCEPFSFNGTDAQKELIVGGEACLWGEYVDATNFISRMWPRASAVAERLWSAASVNDTTSANTRLHSHRCRMVRLGYNVEPVTGPGFCQQEFSSSFK